MRASLLFFLCVWILVPLPAEAQDEHSFRFVRIQYDSNGYNRWGTPWAFDYPTAEINLHQAIERTTRMELQGEPIVLRLEDEAIFQYPVLYLCEPGYWEIKEEEIKNLRKYFERGGFLIIDDFHDWGDGQVGPQWENFYANLKAIFPDREPVELDPSHPIWHIFYDIDPVAAQSTKRMTGEIPWLTSDDDTYYGIFDDNGRMIMIICYNQDIGDGWEWPGRHMGEASSVSFQMAINFILYALSH